MKPRKWTVGEEEFVREHYGKMPAAEIARQLGRKTPMVWAKAYDMGLSGPRVCGEDQARDTAE